MLLLLTACFQPSPGDGDTGHPTDTAADTADAGETGDSGDTGAPLPPVTVDATWALASAMPTVVTVSWDADAAGPGAVVDYGPTDAYGGVASSSLAGTTGEATIYGLAPSTPYHFRVLGPDGRSADATLETGAAPTDLKGMVQTDSDGSAWPGFILTSVFDKAHGDSEIHIFDPQLQPVWWRTVKAAFVPAVRLGRDGASVLYLSFLGIGGEQSEIVRVGLDGREIQRTPAPYAHHDFVELPDGELAYLASEVRAWGDWTLVGDELRVADPKGGTRVIWCAFDSLPPVETPAWSEPSPNPLGVDWTHANGLAHDEARDRWFISAYALGAILQVDGASGSVLGQLGGPDSDYTFVRDSGFGPQHSPEVTPGGILLFDNGDMQHPSRAVEYTLDEAAHTATLAQALYPPSHAITGTLGDADRLPDGDTLTAWGDAGEVILFRADGGVRWSAKTIDADMAITQVNLLPTLAPPP